MIRVLQVLGGLELGGAESFVINLYRTIDREQVQFDFVKHIEKTGAFESEIQSLGGKIYLCPRYNGKNHFAYVKWWNNFFLEHPEYKVLHSHVRSTAAIYLKIAKKHDLITIAHSHSTSNGSGISSMVKYILQLPIRHTADYLFACSDRAGKWLYGQRATQRPTYKMIPNGVDLRRFAFDPLKREEMRTQLGIKKNEVVIGHIGRFTEPKNHKFLIELFAEHHKNNADSRLLMVGDGELVGFVRAQCEAMNLSDCVIMPGSRTDTEDFYQAMDVFVFPSLWEGLPVSVVEAQANGIPCLISDVITRDVVLTDIVSCLSLKNRAAWLEGIGKARNKGHNELSAENEGRLQPFDSGKVAIELQAFYLEQDEKEKNEPVYIATR